MIRRRSAVDGLPFRVYERLGVRTYSIGYKMRSGAWAFRYQCPVGDTAQIAALRRKAIEESAKVNEDVPLGAFDGLVTAWFAMQDGAPWFICADVAQVLGYRDASNAGRVLDDDEKGAHNVSTPGGEQKLTIINESGLYALVLRSRKPEARKFAKWVTSEVLPAIRKTGSYELPNLYKQQPGDKLNSYQQQQLRGLLDEFVKHLPKDKQAGFMMQGWSKLKAHFGVAYRDIPCERFDEAISLLTRHVVEHARTVHQIESPPAPSMMGKRWVMELDRTGREVARAMDWNDCILKYQDLPKLLAAPDNMIAKPCCSPLPEHAFSAWRTHHLNRRSLPDSTHPTQTAFGRFFHGHSASANRPASMASRRVLGRYTPCSACSMRRFLPCTD